MPGICPRAPRFRDQGTWRRPESDGGALPGGETGDREAGCEGDGPIRSPTWDNPAGSCAASSLAHRRGRKSAAVSRSPARQGERFIIVPRGTSAMRRQLPDSVPRGTMNRPVAHAFGFRISRLAGRANDGQKGPSRAFPFLLTLAKIGVGRKGNASPIARRASRGRRLVL